MQTPFPHFGETMALLAALIFSWTSVFFTTASRRLGVVTVNLLRLPGGALCLALVHLAVTGRIWPADLALVDQLWIAASGVVGLAIGDSALFRAFILIGPRRSMTLMALAPVVTVITAWLLLGERLGPIALVGIVVIIGGVMLASLGKDPGGGTFAGLSRRTLQVGLLMALIGAVGQGLGSTCAKLGMTGTAAATETAGTAGIDPLGATLVRMVWAAVAYWVVVLPRQRIGTLMASLQDRRGVAALVVAVLLGPFISVWISLVAIRYTDAGVAQVLLGMVPIFVILPAWIVYRDRPTVLSLLGVGAAVAGGALLFLR